jgi:hypothetical protein
MNRVTIALVFVLITLSHVHAQSSDWNRTIRRQSWSGNAYSDEDAYRRQVERSLDPSNPFVSDSQKEIIRNQYLEYLRHQEQQRIQQQGQRDKIERERQRERTQYQTPRPF